MESYAAFHRRSLDDPRGFWAEQAKLIAWHQAFEQVLDDSSAPINRWFVGGKTNLCHNALDRHVHERGEQKALVFVSTETETLVSPPTSGIVVVN
ncbi:MAG: hypothetical protein EBV34_03255 [Betaproteobacteria bacterium]|nr:hypothetical protein [Betaproteobacteria bacterium]